MKSLPLCSGAAAAGSEFPAWPNYYSANHLDRSGKVCRGTSLIIKNPTPYEHHRALGIALL